MQLLGSVVAMRCGQQTLWLSGAYASLLARRIRPACGIELPAAREPQGVYLLRGTYRQSYTYRLESYLPAQSCLQIEAPAEPPGRAPELCPFGTSRALFRRSLPSCEETRPQSVLHLQESPVLEAARPPLPFRLHVGRAPPGLPAIVQRR